MILIKLVDARRSLNLKCRELFRNEKIAESIYRFLCDGIEECEDFTPADVPDRKVGKWNTDKESPEYATCSVCGHCDWDCTESEYFNYCPNCGAEMKGEADA